eukprot:1154343-Pelagomonas_calceolata.AAC.5
MGASMTSHAASLYWVTGTHKVTHMRCTEQPATQISSVASVEGRAMTHVCGITKPDRNHTHVRARMHAPAKHVRYARSAALTLWMASATAGGALHVLPALSTRVLGAKRSAELPAGPWISVGCLKCSVITTTFMVLMLRVLLPTGPCVKGVRQMCSARQCKTRDWHIALHATFSSAI